MSEFVGPICFRVCKKCAGVKPLEGFRRHEGRKFARQAICKVCQAAEGKNSYRKNTETVAAANKAWSQANPDKRTTGRKAWAQANTDKVNAYGACRRAARTKATPIWADPIKIAEIFKRASLQKFEVDHVYPLRGLTVSGLHVPANLRPICELQNRLKRNKLPGFLAQELWDPTGRDVYHEASQ